MAAEQLFAMTNPDSTCTAASLLWCNMMLSGVTTPTADHFAVTNSVLQRYMHTVGVGTMDADPESQVAMLQFEVVTKSSGTFTSQRLAEIFAANEPYLGIFCLAGLHLEESA